MAGSGGGEAGIIAPARPVRARATWPMVALSESTDGQSAMAIIFKSPAQADVLMFDDDGQRLLELMRTSGELPGALRSEDLPLALERLRAGIEAATPAAADEPPPGDEEDDDAPRQPAVPLAHRALPLMQMLEKAIARDQYVTWTRA